jgi:hypothetical protein
MSTEIDLGRWAAASAKWLKSVRGRDYRLSAIPIETDRQVAEIIEAVLADPARRAPVLLEYLAGERDQSNMALILRIYGTRAAALARRTGDAHHLDLAVLAIGLSFTGDGDYRNGITALIVPWHAAQSLGVDPGLLYPRIGEMPIGEGGGRVQRFAERRPEIQTLQAMGYRETSDAGGVRYERRLI